MIGEVGTKLTAQLGNPVSKADSLSKHFLELDSTQSGPVDFGQFGGGRDLCIYLQQRGHNLLGVVFGSFVDEGIGINLSSAGHQMCRGRSTFMILAVTKLILLESTVASSHTPLSYAPAASTGGHRGGRSEILISDLADPLRRRCLTHLHCRISGLS